MKKGRLRWLGPGVTVFVTMLLVFGAGTATAAGIKKHITLAPSAFTPENNDVYYSLVQTESACYLESEMPDQTACFFAPITFQKGALFLRKAWIYLSENPDPVSAAPSVQVQIVKVDLSEGTTEIIAEDDMFTLDGYTGVQEFELDTISQNEVIKDKFAYQIKICVNDGVRIHGVKVRMKK